MYCFVMRIVRIVIANCIKVAGSIGCLINDCTVVVGIYQKILTQLLGVPSFYEWHTQPQTATHPKLDFTSRG
ncbi:MAG: hypothetical protein Q4G13_09245, partial [Moraxella sp.]|nr:hypothetical protein [Moraxella sp.]